MIDLGLLVLLVAVWLGLSGLTLPDLVIGVVLSVLVLWWAPEPQTPGRSLRERVVRGLRSVVPSLRLALVFVVELCLSSLRVARDVLAPRPRMRPAVLAVPIEARTDAEVTVLSGLLSLTPGVLCIDVAPDRGRLFVHAMYVNPRDLDATRRELRESFEPHVLRALRTPPPAAGPPRAAPGLGPA
ncbi:MAG: Na+/H+ antiporter subunit E [Planctomycetes bacterium]|nr:Na+/H+ antiporter subunit E [Planctomycetota bacterium]